MDRRPERSIWSLVLASAMVVSVLLAVIVVSNSGSSQNGGTAYALVRDGFQLEHISDHVSIEYRPAGNAGPEAFHLIVLDESDPEFGGQGYRYSYDLSSLIGQAVPDSMGSGTIDTAWLKSYFSAPVDDTARLQRVKEFVNDENHKALIQVSNYASMYLTESEDNLDWGSMIAGPNVKIWDALDDGRQDVYDLDTHTLFICRNGRTDGDVICYANLIGHPTPDGTGTIDAAWLNDFFTSAKDNTEVSERYDEIKKNIKYHGLVAVVNRPFINTDLTRPAPPVTPPSSYPPPTSSLPTPSSPPYTPIPTPSRAPSYDYSYDYNPAPASSASPKLPAPDLVVQPSDSPVPSNLQPVVRKEKEIVDWVDRLDLPDYPVGLYEALDQGSTSILNGCLIQDASFTLPASMSGSSGGYKVASVQQVDFELAEMFSNGVSLGVSSFTSEDFYIVNAAQSDSQIDYGALRMGDVVRTPSFNGVFVTSLPCGQSFEQEKKQTCTYISTVFQAFDRDHPEVFWLSGKGRVRIITAGDASGQESGFFFLILADDNGFNMRAPAWNKAGAVTSGIQRRDQAAANILSTVTASAPAEQVRQVNRWLTQHNEYNTSPDLTAIGNEPHECLAALEGRSGREGPVCDGYARAFKVLCDRLGIPCVLENGYAKTAPNAKGVLHMWNAVQIGGKWYGVDVTWNDPTPQRSAGAKSGYENEQFLLVGSSTKVLDMTFAASHPATNRASADGVSFINGPALNASAFSGGAGAAGPSPTPSPTPAPSQPSGSQTLATGQTFYDVPKGSWFFSAVDYAYKHGMMVGTGPKVFTPNGVTTRQELWMILARMDGAAPADMRAARTWAVNLRLTDGAGATGYLSRQEFAATLHHYCALKGYNTFSMFSLDRFPDSRSIAGYAQTGMAWAVGHGLLRGTDKGRLEPVGTTTRAEMATILMRFQEDFAK